MGEEPVTKVSKEDETIEEKKEEGDGVREMEEDNTNGGLDEEKKVDADGEANDNAMVEINEDEPKTEAMEEDISLNEVEVDEGKPEKTEGSKVKMDERKEEVKETEEEKERVKEIEEEYEESREAEEDKEELKECEEGKVEANMGEKEEAKEAEEEKEEAKEAEQQKEDPKEAEKEKEEPKVGEEDKEEAEEGEDEKEESKEGKMSKKRSRARNSGEKRVDKDKKVVEEQEPRTPVTDRPVRERKSVERLVATIEKDNSREFRIEKGSGTLLKDIPNVAYKLSRKKSDETFKLLHNILFGRRGKAAQIKHHISRFSGFVWHDNEEKQRMKVKEKFDKYVKEKLLEFCDVLDIPVAKATIKKEDIVIQLLNFLTAPHATTTVLLAEKDQGKKRKRDKDTSKSSGRRSAKSRKKTADTSKEGKKSASEPDDESGEENEEKQVEKENGVAEGSEDEKSEQSESAEKKDESEDDTAKEKKYSRKIKQKTKKKTSKNESSVKATLNKVGSTKKSSPQPNITPKKSSSSRSKVADVVDKTPKVFSRKKKTEEPKIETSSASKKSAAKEKSAKKAVKGKEKPKDDKLKPSDDELRTAICDILKEVDFNTATFTDILKQLAKQFNTDLTPRKSCIKLMIQDELTKLADEAEDEEEGGGVKGML